MGALCARSSAPVTERPEPPGRPPRRSSSSALIPTTNRSATALAYEVWTPLQDIDRVEDISEVMQVKVAAVRAYRTQCNAMRFDDAVLGLNRYRGEMHSWPGGPYAEIFQQPNRRR